MTEITLLRNTMVDGQPLGEGDSTETDEKTAKYLIAIGKAKPGLDSASKTEFKPPETATVEPPEKAVAPGPRKRK